MSSLSPSLVWFRNDLRIADNPALEEAARRGAPVACLYVLDEGARRTPGAASRWWLNHSIEALSTALEGLGGALLLARGDPAEIVPGLAQAIGAGAVFWNRRYGAAERLLDGNVKATLKARGLIAESFNAALLREPWEVKSQAGQPMKVFTPFWRTAQSMGPFALPTAGPGRLDVAATPTGFPLVALSELRLLPTQPDWAGGLRESWKPGEAGARAALEAFLSDGLAGYAENRDRPDLLSTSRLSPHLAFGEIGPRQLAIAARLAIESEQSRASQTDLSKFLAEIGWREFAHHLLFYNEDLATRNYQSKFDSMAWRDDAQLLKAWRTGRTGYPLVDAGMRQLWQTGWMHNRVRMVAASFLIKHLMIDWRIGEEWFWDTLVDADPANNPAGWQWVAGSGADAAPYYRIFNPVLQGRKFDPDGAYVRRFVPELSRLPADCIHAPWLAPSATLAAAGVKLGIDYPRPVVDHDSARERALAAFKALG